MLSTACRNEDCGECPGSVHILNETTWTVRGEACECGCHDELVRLDEPGELAAHLADAGDVDEALYCSECGCELDFDDCPECGGEGFYEHEPDSEEPWTGFETCRYCGGQGTFQRCPNARYHTETAQEGGQA